MTTKTPIVVFVLAFVVLVAPRAQAQESIEAARQLYAAAEYDTALTMLNGLMTSSTSRDDRRTVALYRTLCLLATNRRAEADRAIETMVTQDPLFRPTAEEIPPRMRTAIADTRKRLLPAILQQKYNESKMAYDLKDFAAASAGFKEMLDGLGDPDIAVAASQSPLADLKTLAVGFYELSVKLVPPSVPPPMSVAEAPLPAPPVPSAPKLYSAEDRNVVPPIPVRQQIPAYPGKVSAAKTGVLELVIDKTGAVESATMRVPVNAQYDRLATSAARNWQYQPATIDGSPVKFLKRIQVSLVPTP
jgi:hypothetical protein